VGHAVGGGQRGGRITAREWLRVGGEP
jgi:hypothetical protein